MSTQKISNESGVHKIDLFSQAHALVKQGFYKIIEDQKAYHILIKIKLPSSSLSCSLSFDERKLVIVTESESRPMSEETAALVFQAPPDANLNEIRVQSHRNAYLISIPKLAARLRIVSSHIIYM